MALDFKCLIVCKQSIVKITLLRLALHPTLSTKYRVEKEHVLVKLVLSQLSQVVFLWKPDEFSILLILTGNILDNERYYCSQEDLDPMSNGTVLSN